MNTLNSGARIAVQINHDLADIFELFSRIDTEFDFEVAGIFYLDVLAEDLLVVDLEGLVTQVGQFICVTRGANNYIGNILQVREDVHE
jgi:hypothetical protein